MEVTNTVTHEIEVEAPVTRVWKAISDAREFGSWLGADIHGEFEPGKRLTGKMHVREMVHLSWDIEVEAMLVNELFVYTWPPFTGDPNPNLSSGPRIRGEFHMRPTENGTLVTLTETGFAALNDDIRVQVFENHVQGWNYLLANFEEYVKENPRPPFSARK